MTSASAGDAHGCGAYRRDGDRRGVRRVAAGAIALVGATVLCATPVHAQRTGAVGGRVSDEATGVAVSGVLVEIAGVTPTLTDERGVFVIRDVPEGPRQLRLEHLAYGAHTRPVLIEGGGELALEITISAQAIELAPLIVEGLTELEQRRLTTGYSMNEIGLPEIEEAARAGLSLSELLQASMPGVSVRAGFGGQTCVTYRAIRSDNDLGDCGGVSVMLDGVPVADPSYVYASIPLRDIERLEMMSPGQGGVRYGMRTGQGVLLVETKRGREQRRGDLSRLLTGLDWSQEEEPYPLLKVFGSALLANAVGVGVGLLLADKCFSTPEGATFALRTRCRGTATAGASIVSVALPAVAGTLAARRGGRTRRSQGRAVPSMVTAGIVLTGGYLLLIGGGEGNSQAAGAAVLAVGVPLTMTFSDRVFRILR